MKKQGSKTIIVLFAFITVLVFDTCKKGDGDAALSLRSRKARVAGEWTVSKYSSDITVKHTFTGGVITTTHTIQDYDGTSAKQTVTETNPDSTFTVASDISLTHTFTFDKNGTWVSSREESSVSTENYSIPNSSTGSDDDYSASINHNILIKTTSENITETTTIVFHPLGAAPARTDSTDKRTSNLTYYAANDIWTITTLKNKKMVIETSLNSSSDEKKNGVQSGVTVDQTGEELIELKQ